jgi:hypothetical protein
MEMKETNETERLIERQQALAAAAVQRIELHLLENLVVELTRRADKLDELVERRAVNHADRTGG